MEGENSQKLPFELTFFKIPIEKYEKDMEEESAKGKKNEILDLLNNHNKLLSEEEFKEIEKNLHLLCIEGDLDLIKIYLSETIKNDSGTIQFKINKENRTASLFKINSNIEEIIIPRTVKHESDEYLITSISGTSPNIKTLKFVEDSAVKTIYEYSLICSKIEKIYFPASLKELKDNWCFDTQKLTKITISPLNGQFKMIEDKYLIGKSDPNSNEFDILLFACRDIKEISIPSNIKIISPFALACCKNLEKVEIPNDSNLQIIESSAFAWLNIKEIFIPSKVSKICKKAFYANYNLKKVKIAPNSELQIIGKRAFYGSNIEEIAIPEKVTKLCEEALSSSDLKKVEIPTNSNLQTIESKAFAGSKIEEIYFPASLKELKSGWCDNITNLNKIKISPLNGQFKMIEDKYLIGKSDPNSDEFDILLFACRDIKEISIPSNIKIISSSAFCKCKNLMKVEIPANLQAIEREAFNECSKIKEIFIPPNVSIISEYAFHYCTHLKKVEIPVNSNLQTIEKYAFYLTKIEKIFIPSKVSIIHYNAFGYCMNLTKLEIPQNSSLQTIGEMAFLYSKIRDIFIPSKVSKICGNAFGACGYILIVEISEYSQLESFPFLAFNSNADFIVMIPSSLEKKTNLIMNFHQKSS